MITRRLVVLALVLSACGSPRAAEPTQDPAAVCRDRFAPIAAELRALSLTVPVPATPTIELPPAHGESATTAAPIVTIARDGTIALDGRATDVTSIAQDLETLGSHWPMLHGGAAAPDFVYVAADRTVSIDRIAEVRAAALGARRVLLLASSDAPPRTDPPCPASAGAACAQPPSTEDPRRMGALLAPTCAGLRNAAIAMPTDDPSAAAELFAGALQDAATLADTCRCAEVDPDLVRYAALRIAGAFDRGRVAIALPPEIAADERTQTAEAWLAAHGSR